jgi:hypothetical protein
MLETVKMITSTLAVALGTIGSTALFLSETLHQEYSGYSNMKHKL